MKWTSLISNEPPAFAALKAKAETAISTSASYVGGTKSKKAPAIKLRIK